MKTMRRRQAGDNVAITLRVMSLRRWTHERCTKPSHLSDERLVTRERDGYVGRAGATLMEVLMSLAIMTIGVVMVATVFPISALRTLEANKQTNSTIARFNAEAVAEVDPQFIHNPDGFFPPAAASDQTPYNGNTFRGHVYAVDPLGWQSFNKDNPQPATPYIAVRDYFGTNPLPPVNWQLPRRYAGATMFGSVNPYPAPGVPADIQAAVTRAFQLVTQPDNWKLVTEAQWVSSSTATAIVDATLDTAADLSVVPAVPTVDVVYRAVIYDIDGVHSEVRYLTASNTATGTIGWLATEPLPTRFDGGNIGKVRVEVADEIYTWMLSVRKRASGPASVDVVVYFKRSFNPDHEIVWPASFVRYTLGPNPITTMTGGAGGLPGADGFDDNGSGAADEIAEIGFPRNTSLPAAQQSDDEPNNYLPIDYTTLPTGAKPPVLRRGGYAYDTRNGLWYRIRAIQNETSTSAVLVLDESIKQNGTEDLNLNGVLNPGENQNPSIVPAVIDQGGVILNPSVVNVFPLEIKVP